MAKEQPSGSSNMRLRRAGAVRGILAKIAWGLGGIIVALLVAAALFISLVNVDGVHRYLLNLAQTKASSMLGVPVSLENFSLDIPALRVDLYGLTIDGAAPHRTPAAVRVAR